MIAPRSTRASQSDTPACSNVQPACSDVLPAFRSVTPSLSVVIPSYRRADLLRRAVISVQRFAPPGTQLIVVDDGSVDQLISRTAAEFPGVQLVRHACSQGFCAAANTGLAAATGTVVELLNDDAEVTAGWAEAALRHFADASVGAVAPLVLQAAAVPATSRELPNPSPESSGDQLSGDRLSDDRLSGDESITGAIIDTAGDEYHPGGFARKRGHGQPFRPTGPYARSGEVWGVSAAAGFYRRDLVLALGGFRPEFHAYFEDVDLSHRIRRAGYRVWYEPASVVWHRLSASYGRQPRADLLMQQSRNEELVFCRHGRWRHWPLHLAVLAAKALRRGREGTLLPWSRGRLQAWRMMMCRTRSCPDPHPRECHHSQSRMTRKASLTLNDNITPNRITHNDSTPESTQTQHP